MPVYGYGRVIDQATELLRLEEVSFDLSAEQLRGVAAFLIDCADRISDSHWVIGPWTHAAVAGWR